VEHSSHRPYQSHPATSGITKLRTTVLPILSHEVVTRIQDTYPLADLSDRHVAIVAIYLLIVILDSITWLDNKTCPTNSVNSTVPSAVQSTAIQCLDGNFDPILDRYSDICVSGIDSCVEGIESSVSILSIVG